MKKKVCLVVAIVMLLSLLFNGIPTVAAGVAALGVWGVNYGIVGFPLLIGLAALYFYRREE